MRKHKKIYYVAGIISALLVPLLFLYYAIPVYNQMNMRVIDIGLPAKAKKGEEVPEYSKIPTEGWNYKKIDVKPNFDKKTEESFIKEINLLRENDVVQTGIRFQLSEKSSYADVVSLLNIMAKTKQDLYGLDTENTNSMYVLYVKPKKSSEVLTCGLSYELVYSDVDEDSYANVNFWNKLIHYFPKESYYLILGFLMLIYCAMFRPKLSFKI